MSAAPHGLLSSIGSPQDLRDLTPDQLKELSGEIRSFLIENVCQTGGHLGPNLGVIELTLFVHEQDVAAAVKAIVGQARTGRMGDGKIMILPCIPESPG